MNQEVMNVIFKKKRKRRVVETWTIFLFYFIFICHTIITKNIGKEEKKKWRGDLTETIGA